MNFKISYSEENPLSIIGLMSGTSLDGLDMAYVHFWKIGSVWKWKFVDGNCIELPDTIKVNLTQLYGGKARQLADYHAFFGDWVGKQVKTWLENSKLPRPDFLASHGQTIFHQPEAGYTFQLGSGANIAASSGIDTICDFRALDVAFGGQGAPLVPVGDALLFSEFNACLNLGGFANISFRKNERMVAYDICACNLVLNQYAKLANPMLNYDADGEIAKTNQLDENLLQQLNHLDFYAKSAPKSLGKEWVDLELKPLFERKSPQTVLATFTAHVAQIIAKNLIEISIPNKLTNVLVTGGGAFNTFLMKSIQAHLSQSVLLKVPDKKIIELKEAIIFAFLGALWVFNEPNALQSVTGASQDSVGGCLYRGNY